LGLGHLQRGNGELAERLLLVELLAADVVGLSVQRRTAPLVVSAGDVLMN
jgi:hypothetical protein